MQPELGDVLSFEVSPGRCVLFRVVAQVDDARCVVLSQWEGKQPRRVPTAKSLRAVQPLAHHQWKRPMIGGWVKEPLPENVVKVGTLAVTRTERARVIHPRDWVNAAKKTAAMGEKVLPMSGWAGLLRDAKAQWRWDHERDAVLAEEAAVHAVKLEAFNRAVIEEQRKKAAALSGELLALRDAQFFAQWTHAPQELVKALEAAMQVTVRALEGKSGEEAVPDLRALINSFNRLDGAHDHEFDAADAEELMEAAVMLSRAAQLAEDAFDERVAVLRKFPR